MFPSIVPCLITAATPSWATPDLFTARAYVVANLPAQLTHGPALALINKAFKQVAVSEMRLLLP